MSNVVISISDVNFSYSKKRIYSNLNLDIYDNEITYIMGNNGCGKTTLLKLICQFLMVQEGKIEVLGNDVSKLDSKSFARYVSYVPQIIHQNIDFMVKDYLVMGRNPYLKLSSSPSMSDYYLVEKYAKQMKIEDILESNFNELSGGQKQMVTITRALIQETPIIIMDEPMSALDIGKQAELLLTINELKKNGKTIILTSHNPNHALQCNCNVCLIDKGHIIGYGKSINVLTRQNIESVYGSNVTIEKGNVRFNLKAE